MEANNTINIHVEIIFCGNMLSLFWILPKINYFTGRGIFRGANSLIYPPPTPYFSILNTPLITVLYLVINEIY